MYEKGEFQCKRHMQVIQNYGNVKYADSICMQMYSYVLYTRTVLCTLYQVALYSVSLSSLLQCTWTIAIPQIAQIHTTQPFQHVLSFPGSPSHSPTYWITGNSRMDRRWFGLPLSWWQVPSRGQQLWGQIWDLTWISWCGPWIILERDDRGRDMFHKHNINYCTIYI